MDSARQNPGFLHLLRLRGGGEWLHMCIKHRETSDFLMDEAALDDLVVAALLEEDTRSRLRVRDDGLMVLLKAMHLRDESMANPEDMVSMRLWLTPQSIISTREADVDPIIAIASRVNSGDGPNSPGDFLADLVKEHLDQVEHHLERLEDDTDATGRMIGNHRMKDACPNIADIETRISGFLRHLRPQRPVLERLSTLDHPVLDDRDRARLDDALNRLLRLLETLQSLRDRLDIFDEQVRRIQERRLSESSYRFAAAATVFLPLTFLTGLFGVNLMGLPFEKSPLGFWFLVGICGATMAGVAAFFRWRRIL